MAISSTCSTIQPAARRTCTKASTSFDALDGFDAHWFVCPFLTDRSDQVEDTCFDSDARLRDCMDAGVDLQVLSTVCSTWRLCCKCIIIPV